MSVQDVLSARAELSTFASNPRAWVLIANPVWGRAEDHNAIAAFDTREAALAYARDSALPAPFRGPDQITRTHRPDSLLYDYNGGGQTPCDGSQHDGWSCSCDIHVRPMVPWVDYGALAQNPVLAPIPPGTVLRQS